jgi:hypothetical protein
MATIRIMTPQDLIDQWRLHPDPEVGSCANQLAGWLRDGDSSMLTDGKCEGPYVKPCIEYADDTTNIRLYQWCAACLAALSARLNHKPFIVNTPTVVEVQEFHELRRWPLPLTLEDLHGKYYGTRVLDANGNEVIKFWHHSDGSEPSSREKERFGDWTPDRWADYCSDEHWESESDLRAALEFIALFQAAASRGGGDTRPPTGRREG